MKLENQVVSLELAKKLKELGFKQESLFYWSDNEDGEWCLILNWKNSQENDPIIYISRELEENEDGGYYPAYTVAELGEMLPIQTICRKDFIETTKHFVWTSEPAEIKIKEVVFAKTEVEARAKMLIYLKENNLI